MAANVNELVESNEEDSGVLGDGSPDELSDAGTPSPRGKLAAQIRDFRLGNDRALREALDNLDAGIDEPVVEGLTVLELATMEGHLSCVEADLEADLTGITPLHGACIQGFTELVDLLLGSADPECLKRMLEETNMEGDTPLHFAAKHEQVDIINHLLASGASLTKTNDCGQTPIDMAEPDSEARRILEEAAQAKASDPETPPHLRNLATVVQSGDVDDLRHALEDLNDSIDVPVERHGLTALLHLATAKGHLSCVQLLLSRGANLEVESEGVTPLHDACIEGFTKIIQLLLQSANSPECVKRMLEAVNVAGNTPLHCAADYNHVDTIRLLLDSGASPTKKNEKGKTPVDMAKPDSEARRILEAAARAP